MATPQEIRRIRLASDYKQMCNIRGSIISWVPVRGTPPYVEEYKVTIRVRTITGVSGNNPVYRDTSVVTVTLPQNYPIEKPKIIMESDPQPFHPNWYAHKLWCCGMWFTSESLGDHVIRMVKTLQYDLDITNENSPANVEAKNWYVANKRSGLFPCDRQKLPDPTKPNPTPPAQSSFVIKSRG